ncbi:MAG: type II/IV secretion system protein [Ignavibacteriales bacterium]|nr:type II/IV secretion system protein [Ignavibacteriales bacterium]
MVSKIIITPEAKKAISPQLAFENNILPLRIEDDYLIIAITDKDNYRLLNDISFNTGYKIKTVEASSDAILKKLKELYPEFNTKNNKNSNEINIQNIAYEYSNVEFVNQVIKSAIIQKSSDIHCESLENSFRIRYRIDGHLREVFNLPKQRGLPILSRLKIMSNLDISEKRRPQDGKIRFQFSNNIIDIRVSSLPTSFGEKIVLRILDKSHLELDINKLGLIDKQLKILVKNLQLPYGMILVTGPTGSGKTTTLYTALQHIYSPDKNILTVEDPIEYNLDGINQCNVKPEIGFDFANALRSFLRQDPDIIMVGEIRDKETAEIAIRAALTGHLVFSTLHTNDSVSGITRLIDMGVEPFLVSSSVRIIIAQRLVRKLCDCKIQEEDKNILQKLNIEKAYKKNGCENCDYTGYKGRTALFEIFELNEDIEELISRRGTTKEIRDLAIQSGFYSLSQAGIEKIKNGITSYEEVLHETMV